MTANCTCALLRSSGMPANLTECGEMLRSCGSSSVPVSVAVPVLLLLAICGVAFVWCWKQRDTTQLAFPRFLQRSGSRRRDYSKTLSPRPRAFGSKCKAPGGAQGRRPAAREADPCDDYENLEVGPPKAEDTADKGLYENARPAGSEEHVYGNESSSPYYNFQKPASPESPPDEDIYILPD